MKSIVLQHSQIKRCLKRVPTHTHTLSMNTGRRGLRWWLDAIVTGPNTPWEIKRSFKPQPLLNTCCVIDQLWWKCKCVQGNRRLGQDEKKGLKKNCLRNWLNSHWWLQFSIRWLEQLTCLHPSANKISPLLNDNLMYALFSFKAKC